MAALLALPSPGSPLLAREPTTLSIATALNEPPRPILTADRDENPAALRTGHLQAMVQLALDDVARRRPGDAAALKVASAESVTWSDGSIGCPQPGMQYTQALVPGYRIRIQAGAEVLEYHAGRSGTPFYCPAGRVVEPAAVDSRT